MASRWTWVQCYDFVKVFAQKFGGFDKKYWQQYWQQYCCGKQTQKSERFALAA
jgi:hypothetical protein